MAAKTTRNNLVKNTSLKQKNDKQVEGISSPKRKSLQHNKALSGTINYVPAIKKNGVKNFNSKKSTFAKVNKVEEVNEIEENLEKEIEENLNIIEDDSPIFHNEKDN